MTNPATEPASNPAIEPPMPMSALKGLAHPLRVQLLDALSAYGPATASALAERFGESSGATSYHLRQLEKHGFVSDDTTRGTGRERWWQRVPKSITLDIADSATPAEIAAGELVMAEWFRTRSQRLQQYVTHGKAELTREWLDSTGTSSSNVSLTAAQAAALQAELLEVLTRHTRQYRNQRVAGARPIQIHVDVFPIMDAGEIPAETSADPSTEPTS